MKTLIRCITLALCLAAAVTLPAASAPKPEPGLHVHIVMFSGREDPKFVITDPKEIAELLGALRGLPPHPLLTSAGSLPLPAFGFRGVFLANHSKQNPEIVFAHVYRHEVELHEKLPAAATAARHFRVETSGTLQDRLISMAKARGVMPKN